MARSPITVGLVVGASLLAAAAPASAQTLFGHVLDRLSGRPLPFAAVILLDSHGRSRGYTLSDSTGKFTLDLPRAGRYELYVDQLAYRPLVSDTFDLRKGERWETLLWVTPIPLALDPMSVTVRGEVSALKKVGFYRREKIGIGYLIDPEKVRARQPIETHELLWGIPGLLLATTSTGTGYMILSSRPHRLLRQDRGVSGNCPLAIVVDGHRFRQSLAFTLDDMVDAGDVLAMEVYPQGGTGAPIQYTGPDTDCGIVLVWTREKR